MKSALAWRACYGKRETGQRKQTTMPSSISEFILVVVMLTNVALLGMSRIRTAFGRWRSGQVLVCSPCTSAAAV